MKKTVTFQINDKEKHVHIENKNDFFHVTIDDEIFEIKVIKHESGCMNFAIAEKRYQAHFANDKAEHHLAMHGQTWHLLEATSSSLRKHAKTDHDMGSLTASMHGVVLDVLVKEGQTIKKGETLILLEAMKMELRISAPKDGTVKKVHCKAGQIVEQEQVLVELS